MPPLLDMRTTHTNETKVFCLVRDADLKRLIAEYVAKEAKCNLTNGGVTWQVDFDDATEGSPPYRVGQNARVAITIDLNYVKEST